jgi:hypothetical protein
VNIVTSKIKQNFLIDYGSDYKSSIFLAGVSRSGTTWISNLINYRNNYRYIFEPFDSNRVKICQNFKDRQYLRPDNQELTFLEPAKNILTGKIKSSWTEQLNDKAITNKRLIKDTRANFLLKWLKVNFPELKIIFLLRHPCAVANSRIKLKWATSLNKYLKQRELFEDYLNPFRQYIQESQARYERQGDVFENSIFSWCCQNYVPLKQFKPEEICVVFYENFGRQPEAELKKMFNFMEKSYDEKALNILKQPSKVSRKDSPILIGENAISSWRKHISEEQIVRAKEILNLFGLDKIYSEELLPHTENLPLVMKS